MPGLLRLDWCETTGANVRCLHERLHRPCALSLAHDPNGQRDHAIRIKASLVWAHFAFVISWIAANKHLRSNITH